MCLWWGWGGLCARVLTFIQFLSKAVLDKGTLDAMLCAYSGLEEAAAKVAEMRAEVWRVLQPGCWWVVISHSGTEKRAAALTQGKGAPSWTQYRCEPVQVQQSQYFMHLLQK